MLWGFLPSGVFSHCEVFSHYEGFYHYMFFSHYAFFMTGQRVEGISINLDLPLQCSSAFLPLQNESTLLQLNMSKECFVPSIVYMFSNRQ